MNIEHWQGAQWVLATAWTILTIVSCFAVQHHKDKDTPAKIGWVFGRASSRVAVAAVLYWGGFWA